MAAVEYFSIGMVVSCETLHEQKIQGEVIAFDYTSKILVLKCPSASSKPSQHDVRLLNLNCVSDVKVIREATETPAPLKNINYHKLNARVRDNVQEKMRKVNYVGVGVTHQAQLIFNCITKTINDVKWEGKNIIVLSDVTIYPPYDVESCKGKEPAAVDHVRRIIKKYYQDQQREPSPASSSSSS